MEDKQRRLRAGAHLSQPQVSDGDITEYRMGLTPEQSAALEAALGPLSKPIPDPQTGVFDERSNGQRRAEALMTIVTGHAASDGDGKGPAAASTALHVTIGLADLIRFLDLSGHDLARCELGHTNAFGMAAEASGQALSGRHGAGVVGGSTAAGTLLNPGDVRRLACDADIIPIVLGAAGEVLDVGRAARLYTRGQRRALSHRDRGCTWPGCTSPAAWAKAHHVVHWADGGRSDLTNAALLCQRHHTHVHDRRLVATIHPPDEHGRCVTWDTTPGSYDRVLPARLAELRAASTRRRDLHRADAHARRLALDTGGPDPWRDADPDEDDFIETLMAEHEAAMADALPWPDEADLFDVA
ncbi:DUF222 domain-containing protein [Knoellia sp. CPCC 206453]|uniref:HNH endonuclease signature motif containing protein n=1 Tax=Knoellia pratensis TaxID=3404796 RepID=UPI0036117949